MSICLPTDFCFTKVIYKKDESSLTNKSDDEILQPLDNDRLALSLDDSSRYEGYVDGHIAGREEGRAEGEAKGRAEGRAEGELQKALEMAKKMLSDGMPIDLVAKYSGLTPDEIAKI
jgi:predicted transposase/invertase (TIGR01784 family)